MRATLSDISRMVILSEPIERGSNPGGTHNRARNGIQFKYSSNLNLRAIQQQSESLI
jgi:hypothetical protein